MARNDRIQWLHKKIVDSTYPNAQRLADNFGISLSQAKRDVEYLRTVLEAPLKYVSAKHGYIYESPYYLPVYLTSSNDEELNGMLSSIESDIDATTVKPIVQMQIPYFATIEVSDKLALLDLRAFIIEKEGKHMYSCAFHSVELFLSVIVSLNADIRIVEPKWLRKRLVDSAKRVIKNNGDN